jgi:uncharacterized membrane protein
MKTLFAIRYSDPAEAGASLEKLKTMQSGATISILDAVIVTRSADGAIKLQQSINTTAIGALSGAMWGSLIGLIFLAPVIGAAVGATAGAASGYFTDYGISDGFMRSMAEKQDSESTILFILAADMTADKVADTLGKDGGKVVYTSMPDDIEQRFKSRFGPSTAAAEPEVETAAAALDS